MQPKYIQNLIKKAKEREQYREIVYEKKIAKERSKDDHLYADKDKFITEAYRKKLAERERQMELERLRELQEERDDVCFCSLNFSLSLSCFDISSGCQPRLVMDFKSFPFFFILVYILKFFN